MYGRPEGMLASPRSYGYQRVFQYVFIFLGVFMCFYIFLVVEALLGVTGHDI